MTKRIAVCDVSVVLKNGYEESDAKVFFQKWKTLRNNAPRRGAACLLTFKQYVRLARKAGLDSPNMIGNNLGDYQMARRGDCGDYVLGNCRFITKEENLAELVANGGHARGRIGTGPKISATITGLNKTNCDWRRAISETLSGRKASTHEHVAQVADAKASDFVAISPQGKRIKGRNVNEFCREHGLQQPNFHRVLCGERKQHKGWMGWYANRRV